MLGYMQAKVFFGSPVKTHHLTAKQGLNVIIAYDDTTAAQRAVRLVSSLERNHGEGLKFELKCWRFDILEDHAWREFATADAIKADLLILSASGKCELPEAVQSWVTTCLREKRGDTAGVVALFGTDLEMDNSDSTRIQFLKKITRQFGLDFFAPMPAPQATVADFHHETEKGEEALHPTRGFAERHLTVLAGADGGGSYRHWGINE